MWCSLKSFCIPPASGEEIQVEDWRKSMRKAAKSMRRCAQSTGKHLSLRGGGGEVVELWSLGCQKSETFVGTDSDLIDYIYFACLRHLV